jgi:hypothetical protein
VRLRRHSTKSDVQNRRSKLSAGALAWVDAVWDDADYQRIRALRQPLLHAHIARSLFRPVNPGHRSRTKFDNINARDLILMSRDVADQYVEQFLTAIVAGQFKPPGQAPIAFP